jgi:hypothetical protein
LKVDLQWDSQLPKRKPKENIAKQFAALYVNGPEGVAGNWEACEKLLKKKIDNTQEVREAILAEGGHLGEIDQMPPAPKKEREIVEGDLEELDLSKYAIATTEEKSDDEWKKLAKELAPTIRDISQGLVKASAAQTAIIKHVMDRAYGRIGQKEQQLVANGVVILPTLGERSEMFLCPVCLTKAEKLHPRKEENG